MKRIAATLLLIAAAPVGAQTAPADPAVAASRGIWQTMTQYVTRAAEQMPEADYAFRPTEDVRTFGQILAHVAGAQFMICAAALGEPPRAEDAIERTRTTKADIVQALRESTEYCARAYAMSDARAMEGIELFGMQMSRLGALNLNAAHNGEHYGNLVTYLRIRGMVPPSSQGGG